MTRVTCLDGLEKRVVFYNHKGEEIFRVWVTDSEFLTNIDVVTPALNEGIHLHQEPVRGGDYKGGQINCVEVKKKRFKDEQ
jgi:hypothetical protein